MSRIRMMLFFAAVFCLACQALPAQAAQVDCGDIYCFTQEDFSGGEPLSGICITQLPDSWTGTVMLGDRVLRPGDILTADQIAQMTFSSARTEEDVTASMEYLPISDGHVSAGAVMTLSIRGREDQAPVAEDSAHETYKNIPLEGNLKVTEPEGQSMTFAVQRNPRRGTLEIHDDGSFTYTPKKNKIGTDSFTYTATDATGHISREATVTIQILKPSDTPQYTDTQDRDCLFQAEWMKHTGIFIGEQVGDNICFYPDTAVTRGEFVTMLVKALELPTDAEASLTGYGNEIPQWLRPYLAAAIRSGLTDGLPAGESFGYDESINGAEAAVMLQNALDLTLTEGNGDEAEEVPAWAQDALRVLAQYGFSLSPDAPLTREMAALCLYRAHELAADAPGIQAMQTSIDRI